MARPIGQAAITKQKVMDLVRQLCKPFCFASDKWIGNKLKVSPRTVRRILLALEQEGAIVRTRFLFKVKEMWKTRRHIRLVGEKSKWGRPRIKFVGLATPPSRPPVAKKLAHKGPIEIPGEHFWAFRPKPFLE